jgi:Pyruvate/2-oxoacid:ferredoxin oxidoreductase gamma subunit
MRLLIVAEEYGSRVKGTIKITSMSFSLSSSNSLVTRAIVVEVDYLLCCSSQVALDCLKSWISINPSIYVVRTASYGLKTGLNSKTT